MMHLHYWRFHERTQDAPEEGTETPDQLAPGSTPKLCGVGAERKASCGCELV